MSHLGNDVFEGFVIARVEGENGISVVKNYFLLGL